MNKQYVCFRKQVKKETACFAEKLSGYRKVWSMSKLSSKKRETYFRSLPSGTPTYEFDLVTMVTSELMSCSCREEILGRLPRLLETYGEAQVSLWQKQGDAYAEVRGSSLQPIKLSLYEKIIEKVMSTREPSFFNQLGLNQPGLNQPGQSSAKPLKTVSAIALPLFEGEEIVVVLKLERGLPFRDTERKNLAWLAATVSCLLTTLAERMKSTVITSLSQALLTAHDTTTIAERVLKLLSAALNIESGALLAQQGSHLHTLASVGTLPESLLQPGLSTTTAWLSGAYKQGKPSYYPSLAHKEPSVIDSKLASFVVYPLGETLPTRFILFLASTQVRWWLQTEKDLLASVGGMLSLALRSTESGTRLKTLLTLQSHSLAESETSLLHEIVLAAVQTVPGAEAGRLLIYQGKKFHFRATVGYDTVGYDTADYDLSTLHHLSLRASDIKAWHHSAPLRWDQGEPRIFSSSHPEQRRMLEDSALSQLSREAERVKANLYFPITQQGRVLAILMLDNFTDPEAFGSDSLEAVGMFAPPIALLLREHRYKYLLEKATLTDPLTNLDNHMSFNQAIAREFTRSQRYASPFSVLVLDLGQLKNHKDALALSRSDAVLIEVASVLKKVMRPSDLLFHWRGDEFAAILPNTAYQGGVVAARRCARAIKRIPKESLPITIHIGVASYPTCATSTTTLVQVASERLHKGKANDITVFLAERLLTLEE
jgi:diguanylate cyclase (GGDEF)-like protein